MQKTKKDSRLYILKQERKKDSYPILSTNCANHETYLVSHELVFEVEVDPVLQCHE
jgi:hypothetical protein